MKHLIKYLVLLLVCITFIQCKSYFNCLPNNILASDSISGTYKNSALLSPFGTNDLWHCLNRRSKIKNEGHYVRLTVLKNTLHVQLINGEKIVEENKLKGILTDSCFIVRKKYMIVPILPVLWFYDNQQIRISARNNSLLVDEFTENGGLAIIWAGGDNWKNTYEYRKINKNETTNTAP